MGFKPLLFLIAVIALLLPACTSENTPITGDPTPASRQETNSTNTQFSDCPVTQHPELAFIPPEPWPSQPPGTDEFWFGDRGLWTTLPQSGSWRQLALGEKINWAMLVGVDLASPGCWEFTGQYKDRQLSFVVWVPEE